MVNCNINQKIWLFNPEWKNVYFTWSTNSKAIYIFNWLNILFYNDAKKNFKKKQSKELSWKRRAWLEMIFQLELVRPFEFEIDIPNEWMNFHWIHSWMVKGPVSRKPRIQVQILMSHVFIRIKQKNNQQLER